VLHEGYLYLSDAEGFLECLEARTGKNIWKERLGGTLWGSLLLAGDRIYVSNLEGRTFVVAANPKFQLRARNDLAEPTYAALAVSKGELFVRTYQHLYCIYTAK
jgi:outer membrane protein assembly factor BamB